MPAPMPRDFEDFARTAEDQLPPHNIELEDAVIGSILFDPGALALVANKLGPECFTLTSNRTIYHAALELRRQDKQVSLGIVVAFLKDRDWLELAGGTANIARLLQNTLTAINVGDYAQALLDYHRKRELIRVGQSIAQLGHQRQANWEDLIQDAERSLFSLSQQQREDRGLVPMCDLTAESFAQAEFISMGNDPGIRTGFYDLDALTKGLQPQDLVTVAGRPSMGKTALVINLVYNIAQAYPNLTMPIFSLEMSRLQVMHRFEAIDSSIPAPRIQSGRFSETDWAKYSQSLYQLGHYKIFVDDSASITVPEIASKCRQLKSQQGQLGPIIIDYLQLMGGAGEDNNKAQEVAKITRALKILARELDAPIIILSQLNRGVESRNNKRPLMSDLRDSGSIEQDSDLVVLLYRDEYYNPDTPDRGICELNVAKHRNGPVGTVKLLFDPTLTLFRNAHRSWSNSSFEDY